MTVVSVFFFHFIGDYVLQSRWMGENKSKEMWPLVAHISVYTLVLGIGMSIIFGLSFGVMYALINGVLHMAVDFVTSRIARKAYEDGNMGKFWRTIGMDQFLHNACLLLSFLLMLV